MKYVRTRAKGARPGYLEEASNPNLERNEHTPGWPHYDRQGNCICFCKRCFGPGCVCKGCAGKGHVNCPHADHQSDGKGNITPLPTAKKRGKIRV